MAKFSPNVFFAVQIRNPEIHRHVVTVQDAALKHDPRLAETVEPVERSHITLLVANIEDEAGIATVRNILENYCRDVLRPRFGIFPLRLEIKGVSSFGTRVLYGCPQNKNTGEDVLGRIARELRELLEVQEGVTLEQRRTFNPHITILKVRGSKGKVNKIPVSKFSEFTDLMFGVETVASVQLLSMKEARDERGYYHSFGEFPLCDQNQESAVTYTTADHVACCSSWRANLTKTRMAARQALRNSEGEKGDQQETNKQIPRRRKGGSGGKEKGYMQENTEGREGKKVKKVRDRKEMTERQRRKLESIQSEIETIQERTRRKTNYFYSIAITAGLIATGVMLWNRGKQ